MFVVVPRFDRLRAGVEAAIRSAYAERYGASLQSFAPTIVAELAADLTIECAAGVRLGEEGLFSECYVDQPFERIFQSRYGLEVERSDIVEVSHLAGPNVGRSITFVKALIKFLHAQQVDVAIFTATKALRALLRRNGVAMLELGRADCSRVTEPAVWGSYFDHDPRVMAVVRHGIGVKTLPPDAAQIDCLAHAPVF